MKPAAYGKLALFCILVLLGIGSRLGQDYCTFLPPNFHAVGATALLAGMLFRNTALAVAVPLVAMFVSDLKIGGHEWPVMVTVYACLALPVAFRNLLGSKLSAVRVAGCAVATSTIFFVATNFAHWLCCCPVHNAETLLRCYAAAVPFFGYTLSGDLLYSAALFGAYALATQKSSQAEAFAAAN